MLIYLRPNVLTMVVMVIMVVIMLMTMMMMMMMTMMVVAIKTPLANSDISSSGSVLRLGSGVRRIPFGTSNLIQTTPSLKVEIEFKMLQLDT